MIEETAAKPATEGDGHMRQAPPGMMRVTKTELVWPGKYNEDGTRREVPRVSLPFQVIERVNESRATREAKQAPDTLSLFSGLRLQSASRPRYATSTCFNQICFSSFFANV